MASEGPDLVLLDVMMPVMDGFATCRRLKENDETRLIPVVIMTALDGLEDRIRGIEAGADDFLTKPVNPRELTARIQTALKLKHAVDRKLTELRRMKDHFARFVPESVKRLVTANPDAPELEKSERDVSVLFCDVSGYSRLSEELSPNALNALVESYFSAFLDKIHDAGGDINETAGDGFMAIFEASTPETHARQAAGTAIQLLDITERLNGEYVGSSTRDPHGTQLRPCARWLDSFRGCPRQPLDFHCQWPGHEYRCAPRRACSSRPDTGRS